MMISRFLSRNIFCITLLFSLAFVTGCTRSPSTYNAFVKTSRPKTLAFVNSPVCDLIHTPPNTKHKHASEKRFSDLPCSGSWERLHQLVLNQPVYILEEFGHEALIEMPGPYAIGKSNTPIHLKGWVLKKHLTHASVLNQKKHRGASFPDIENLGIGKGSGPHMALIKPYPIAEAGITLSAGTHFVIEKELSNAYITSIWDSKNHCFHPLSVPKSIALAKVDLSRKAAVNRFIGLLRFWATQKEGFIPYVLGGCSWTHNYQNPRFQVIKGHKAGTVFEREEKINAMHSGFDCSTLIYAAAKMAGIPYQCKNTRAISHFLKPLKKSEFIERGDLLLYPGHVVIITSVSPLKILQARGYSLGVGKVVENDASDLIQGVRTAEDLLAIYRKSQPLIWKMGSKKTELKRSWNIYKIRSAWQAFEPK